MPGEPAPRSTTHGLLFLMFLSFIASFLIARGFATLNPSTVVIAGGIHFHHFWYGLAMIVAAGGLGIVHNDPRYRRLYAVVFGLGGGLVGDEIGLLLTFGNYDSVLTLYFFVTVVSLGVLGMLFGRYRGELEYDVVSLGNRERLVYIGIVVAGLSALPFAAGMPLLGAVTLAAGIAVVLAGWMLHRKKAT
ncbi:MAG: hypothetical protein OK441_01950 [Thaumarchaeota archaeon]|nr:hypothetical protein [Nitrososphaerota archaeon]